jgi:hypothetical protein
MFTEPNESTNFIVTFKFDGVLSFFIFENQKVYSSSLSQREFREEKSLFHEPISFQNKSLILICEKMEDEIVIFDCDLKHKSFKEKIEILKTFTFLPPFRLTKTYDVKDVNVMMKELESKLNCDGLVFTPSDSIIKNKSDFLKSPTLKWKPIASVDFLILPMGNGNEVLRTLWCCKQLTFDEWNDVTDKFKIKFDKLDKSNSYWPVPFQDHVLDVSSDDAYQFDHLIVECKHDRERFWKPIRIRFDKTSAFNAAIRHTEKQTQECGLSCINHINVVLDSLKPLTNPTHIFKQLK